MVGRRRKGEEEGGWSALGCVLVSALWLMWVLVIVLMCLCRPSPHHPTDLVTCTGGGRDDPPGHRGEDADRRAHVGENTRVSVRTSQHLSRARDRAKYTGSSHAPSKQRPPSSCRPSCS
jgi:hypothetical protein